MILFISSTVIILLAARSVSPLRPDAFKFEIDTSLRYCILSNLSCCFLLDSFCSVLIVFRVFRIASFVSVFLSTFIDTSPICDSKYLIFATQYTFAIIEITKHSKNPNTIAVAFLSFLFLVFILVFCGLISVYPIVNSTILS